MCRSRSFAKTWPLLLLGVSLLLWPVPSLFAATCRMDTACIHALERLSYAKTTAEQQAASRELEALYQRIRDPRILANLGFLQLKLGEMEQAEDSCRRAQTEAPNDDELQKQMRECIGQVESRRDAMRGNKAHSPPDRPRSEVRKNRPNGDVRSPNKTHPQSPVLPPPEPPQPSSSGVSMTVSKSKGDKVPLHRRPWLWVGVGGGVAILAIGLTVGLWPRQWHAGSGIPEYTF